MPVPAHAPAHVLVPRHRMLGMVWIEVKQVRAGTILESGLLCSLSSVEAMCQAMDLLGSAALQAGACSPITTTITSQGELLGSHNVEAECRREHALAHQVRC